jgi:HK97 family phage portal protein
VSNPLKSLLDRFKAVKKSLTNWREFGGFVSIFVPFGRDMYKSGIVRSCIRALAEHTSKANPVSKDQKLELLLRLRPNPFMCGKAFLYKARVMYELTNTVFILIVRGEPSKGNKPVAFYPVPYTSFEALQAPSGEIYIEFTMANGRKLIAAWADLVVLRKDYNSSDIAGDDNTPILDTLDLIWTSEQGIGNAVKSTANLRGIIKSTKAMLDPADIKQMKDDFVRDYMNMANEGGVAALDSTTEFKPIEMNPTVTNWAHLKEFRENVFRYFGVNDKILMGTQTPDEMQAFYESKIEPFLIELSEEITAKLYTDVEIMHGNRVQYEANTIQFMSTKEKLALVSMVDRGALTPNEWRAALNLHPIEGGDVPVRRLDTVPVTDLKNKEDEDE